MGARYSPSGGFLGNALVRRGARRSRHCRVCAALVFVLVSYIMLFLAGGEEMGAEMDMEIGHVAAITGRCFCLQAAIPPLDSIASLN